MRKQTVAAVNLSQTPVFRNQIVTEGLLISDHSLVQVLLVENQTLLGRFMGVALMEAGYSVAKVAAPEEVGPVLKTSAMDVIIFNTGLPAEVKSDFIHNWRQMAPLTKILEISEEPLIKSTAGLDMTTIAGPDSYLRIPFLIEEVPAAVEALLKTDALK